MTDHFSSGFIMKVFLDNVCQLNFSLKFTVLSHFSKFKSTFYTLDTFIVFTVPSCNISYLERHKSFADCCFVTVQRTIIQNTFFRTLAYSAIKRMKNLKTSKFQTHLSLSKQKIISTVHGGINIPRFCRLSGMRNSCSSFCCRILSSGLVRRL